jgi:NAD(P)-dependent dehydrogenase (short-subunit alcohol dehydrogenase family)
MVWTADLGVTDTAAVRAVVARAFADLGRIDVVFSNAGRARPRG